MESMKLIGLNLKWYRYKLGLTQEEFASRTKFKTAFVSTVETGDANLTCSNIDYIADVLKIKPKDLFEESTAL